MNWYLPFPQPLGLRYAAFNHQDFIYILSESKQVTDGISQEIRQMDRQPKGWN